MIGTNNINDSDDETSMTMESTRSQKPTLVADIFHYSSYYWREFGVQSSNVDEDTKSEYSEPDPAEAAPNLRYRSPSFGGSLDEFMSPRPINNDRIKLKFYAQVLGDGRQVRSYVFVK